MAFVWFTCRNEGRFERLEFDVPDLDGLVADPDMDGRDAFCAAG